MALLSLLNWRARSRLRSPRRIPSSPIVRCESNHVLLRTCAYLNTDSLHIFVRVAARSELVGLPKSIEIILTRQETDKPILRTLVRRRHDSNSITASWWVRHQII